MYKIYFGSRLLLLTHDVDEAMSAADVNALHKYATLNELRQFVDKFKHGQHLGVGCVYFHDLDTLWSSFCQLFRPVVAAGGLVRSGEGKYLIIRRLGVVDLPKGKSENDETPSQTALREVEEETGLQHLHLGDEICKTYHTYPFGDQTVLKTTHWFRMSVDGAPTPTPQTEENIAEATWLTADEVKALIAETYASLKCVLEEVR